MTSQLFPDVATPPDPPLAVVTGASLGLGRALTRELARQGWHVVVDARDGDRLRDVFADAGATVTTVPGDIADLEHRAALVDAVRHRGRLDLLVSNASVLGPSPQPRLADYPLDALRQVFAVNTFAPLALWQAMLPVLRRPGGIVVHVSSDAAVEAYEGWGGYGSAKAALDQLTAVIAAENPDLAVYAVDPGDMATDLHQQAFPGADISDRPSPDSVVPAFLELLRTRPASGRYRAADLLAGVAAGAAAGVPR